jgi:hypothetical protein
MKNIKNRAKRRSSVDRARTRHQSHRLMTTVAAAIGVIAGAAGLTVMAYGAVQVFGHPAAATSPPTTSTVQWIVPHDQTMAPVVPTSGGAASGAGSFNAVSCPSATECVAVGADGTFGGVASTSLNGGSTWAQGRMDANEPQLESVDCFSTSICVAVGQGASVRSIDGGKTWTSSTVPTSNTTLLGVSCPSAMTCVSVGVSPGEAGPYAGQLLVSTNGGTSWSVPTLPAMVGALGSVDCPTSTFCVSVGSSIVVSTDGGVTWSQRTVTGGTGVLRSVACLSASTCVAVGANPGVAQDPSARAFGVVTTDGGATWRSVVLPAGSATLDVVSCSNTTCEAAGSEFRGTPAQILVSPDGSTWSANQLIGTSVTAVSALSCASGANCVFVGEKGKSPITLSTVNGVASTPSPVSALVRTQKDVTR